MNRLRIFLACVLIIALAAPAFARAPNQPNPPGRAHPAYGCCCALTVWLGLCPQPPGKFMQGFHDVCFGEDGEFCRPGDEGHYPFRGMTPREVADALGFGTVGEMIDFFCGRDWEKWLSP